MNRVNTENVAKILIYVCIRSYFTYLAVIAKIENGQFENFPSALDLLPVLHGHETIETLQFLSCSSWPRLLNTELKTIGSDYNRNGYSLRLTEAKQIT